MTSTLRICGITTSAQGTNQNQGRHIGLTPKDLPRRGLISVPPVEDFAPMCKLPSVETTIADVGVNEEETPSRLILALERIADALDRIAWLPTSATEKNMSPASGDPLLQSGTASMGQRGSTSSSPVSLANMPVDKITSMEAQLTEIRNLLRKQETLARTAERKSYTVEEVAELTRFTKWTIRNACSKGRIKADKSPDGQWRISHEELLNIQNHGLPPQPIETASP
jgi:excisionase family DNA binding protein